jgi:hypothetical protein
LAAKLLNAVALGLTGLMLSLLAAALAATTPDPGGTPTSSRLSESSDRKEFSLSQLKIDAPQSLGKLLAPALVLCYPLLFYTASTLYPQTLGTLIFALCIYLLLASPESAPRAVTFGFLFGFLVLLIPSFLLLAPIFPVYLVWAGRFKKLSWRNAILLSLCATLVVMPWTIRNYIQFRSFIPVSANSGVNLLLGNSPNTTANSGVNVDVAEYQRQAHGLSDIQRDKFFAKCAIGYVRQHPVAAFKLYCAKVLNYFNFRNKLYSTDETSRAKDVILFVTYYPLLLVAVARLFLFRRFKLTKPEVLLYFLYFGNAFLSAIFFTRIRFRIPFDALLLVLVASFLSRLWTERIQAHRSLPE